MTWWLVLIGVLVACTVFGGHCLAQARESGETDELRVASEELEESLGAALLPVVRSMIQQIERVAIGFREVEAMSLLRSLILAVWCVAIRRSHGRVRVVDGQAEASWTLMRPVRITVKWRKRDWRWLWLRRRAHSAVVFKGYVRRWERY